MLLFVAMNPVRNSGDPILQMSDTFNNLIL